MNMESLEASCRRLHTDAFCHDLVWKYFNDTVWSVNKGLSGNPLETSGNPPHFLEKKRSIDQKSVIDRTHSKQVRQNFDLIHFFQSMFRCSAID